MVAGPSNGPGQLWASPMELDTEPINDAACPQTFPAALACTHCSFRPSVANFTDDPNTPIQHPHGEPTQYARWAASKGPCTAALLLQAPTRRDCACAVRQRGLTLQRTAQLRRMLGAPSSSHQVWRVTDAGPGVHCARGGQEGALLVLGSCCWEDWRAGQPCLAQPPITASLVDIYHTCCVHTSPRCCATWS